MGARPRPPRRCPFFSRAYNAQCDKPAGHDGSCSTFGDGFRPGFIPGVGEVKP
jgi:hypothetical protein